jgi:hypothetical protein
MKMFVTEKEAADQLGLPVSKVHQLGEDGVFQQFIDKDITLFKQEQVDLYKESEEYRNLSDKGAVFVPQKDYYGSATLIMFSFCALVFLVSVFARRPQLLEFVVPPLALVGLVCLGLNLLKHYKDKEQKRKAAETAAETDRVLDQIDRLQRQSERKR